MITNVLPVTLDQAIPVVHALHPVRRHFLIDGYRDGKQATNYLDDCDSFC